MPRKTLSKKIRFEVFKRDSFTCQYCGRMAPDAILEVDHINPVKNNGSDDIINLITSCHDCNNGKGAKTLSDNDALKKQQKQLRELNERRTQMEMLVEWKKELNDFEERQAESVSDILEEKAGFGLSEHGKQRMRRSIKTYGMNEVIEATYISIEQYHRTADDKAEQLSINEKVANYIHRICAVRQKNKTNPMHKHIAYIRGILRNRKTFIDENWIRNELPNIISEENADAIKEMAKYCKCWSHFRDDVEDTFGG